MDNMKLQIKFIRKYHDYLEIMYKRSITMDEAGMIWCKRCAKLFRDRHPF